MRTKVIGAAVVLLLCIGMVAAEEVKGKIKTFDSGKGRIVVTVNGKDQSFLMSRATKFVDDGGKDLQGGIDSKELTAGVDVTLTYDKKGARASAAKEVKLSKK